MAFSLSGLTSLFTNPGVQAIGAGLLSGVVGGTALVTTGIIPVGSTGEPAGTIELLACPDTGPAMARISDGSRLLVTGRSEDGAWLEVYIGQPGIDRAWIQATSLELQESGDALPVADCAAPSPDPLQTLGPPPSSTPEPTSTPTASPSPSVTAIATASATTNPSATPTSTPRATPTKSPKPTPSKTPTPTPSKTPTPTPTPTPFVDSQPPQLSNLTTTGYTTGDGRYFIWGPACPNSPPYSATITVTATDNVQLSIVDLYYWPGGENVLSKPVTHQSGTTWTATINAENQWDADPFNAEVGLINYWVVAYDTSNNESDVLSNSNSYRLYMGWCSTG